MPDDIIQSDSPAVWFKTAEEAIKHFDINVWEVWGTYGKHQSFGFECHWVRLADCSTNHLESILSILDVLPTNERVKIHIITLLRFRPDSKYHRGSCT